MHWDKDKRLVLQNLAIKFSPAHDGKMLQLKVTIDEGGAMYIRDFLEARTIKDPETKDAASLKQHTAQVQQVLRDLASPKFKKPEKYLKDKDKPQSKAKQPEIVQPAVNDANAVTIMLSMDDELGDIPEEQRRYIADEITGFRTRSAKRDADRQSKIADAESRRAEFEKAARGSSGLAQQQQARHLRRVEEAQDASLVLRPRRDLHTEAERGMTNAEIHASRERAAELALAPRIAEAERRLVHRERQRLERLEQEAQRLQGDARRAEEDRLHAARKYAVYEDAKEDARGLDTYFSDFGAWRRHRLAYRQRELQADDEDRMAEERELVDARRVQSAAKQHASAAEAQPKMDAVAPVRLTIAKQAEKKAMPAGTLLDTADDDEAYASARKRKLVPMQFEAEDDRVARLKRIVDAIPVVKEALWEYNVPWQYLEHNGLQDKLKSFVAKKCVEAIGVEAEELIQFVMEHVASHGSAADLEQEMLSAIGDEEEAAAFTVKCWRYLLILLETATL
ncbi:hypothetical protein BCR37DRAFT_376391 [Protomyces lactucae-debilis]|uniref:PWI domain-containing protein n=1 Tax=Protomyces lactucae-debilis TaxID=2754530 RepID=A0A1Y2FSQ7_PROLT|nr:uncharacterized protein BCR37DRAFT_376391 [Protomyces lactucae-debilis]ORY87033.1 hypothetical protein BCR37DRAFT_376391 [Protomyces lactucae-debilis]